MAFYILHASSARREHTLARPSGPRCLASARRKARRDSPGIGFQERTESRRFSRRPLSAQRALLALLFSLVACTSSEETADDAGRDRGAGRDVGASATTDTSAPADAFVEDAFVRPDVTPADVSGTDAQGADGSGDADTSPTWPPLPETDNADIRNTVIASRSAIDAYCACCMERFGDDLATCRELALDGGFVVGACELDALENLDDGGQASGYLRCLQVAFANLETDANACTGTTCLLGERDFRSEVTRCDAEFPSPSQRLALCE